MEYSKVESQKSREIQKRQKEKDRGKIEKRQREDRGKIEERQRKDRRMIEERQRKDEGQYLKIHVFVRQIHVLNLTTQHHVDIDKSREITVTTVSSSTTKYTNNKDKNKHT